MKHSILMDMHDKPELPGSHTIGGPRDAYIPTAMGMSSATIAVVDDDRDTREFLCEFFAMDGIAAVPCLPQSDLPTCLVQSGANVIILDVYLDGKTGVDVLHQLRRTPTTQTTPVVFFSGSREKLEELLPDYAAHGAVFVPKPDVLTLKTVIEGLVQPSP